MKRSRERLNKACYHLLFFKALQWYNEHGCYGNQLEKIKEAVQVPT